MKVAVIPDKCDLKVAKSSAFKIKTEDHVPNLHGVFLAVGKRGSGKSTAATGLIKMYQEDKSNSFRVLVISPTFNSNLALMKDLNIDENDIWEDPDDPTIVDQIKAVVEQERDDYIKYHYLLKRYNDLMKSLQNHQNLDQFEDLLLEFYDPYTNTFNPPKHRHNGKKPVMILVCDDCQSTRLYSNRKFNNLITRHRHIGMFPEGGALGITIMMAAQNYTAQNGGISKAVRGNVTVLFLWKTKNSKELDFIADEFSGEISKDEFYKVYEYATATPHAFLMIDLHPKDIHPSGFRKNFNEFILKSSVIEKDDRTD